MKLRNDYKDEFLEKHGVKLGYMSAFVKVRVCCTTCNLCETSLVDKKNLASRMGFVCFCVSIDVLCTDVLSCVSLNESCQWQWLLNAF